MSDVWTPWEGHVIDGTFPLQRVLGASDHSGVFLTELRAGGGAKAALKLVPAIPSLVEAQLAHWRAAIDLQHPRLIRLYECGRCQLGERHFLFLVMEYADQTLAEVLPHRALTADEAHEMLIPALDALSFLHGRKLVQGQVKPANILVVADQLKLASDTVRPASEATANIATPSVYDAPEMEREIFTTAVDIWALGATLVEALTQRPPSWARNEVELPPDFAPRFAEPVRLCLSSMPSRRPDVTELSSWLSGNPNALSKRAAAAASARTATAERAASSGRATASGAGTGPERASATASGRTIASQRAAAAPEREAALERTAAAPARADTSERAAGTPERTSASARVAAASERASPSAAPAARAATLERTDALTERAAPPERAAAVPLRAPASERLAAPLLSPPEARDSERMGSRSRKARPQATPLEAQGAGGKRLVPAILGLIAVGVAAWAAVRFIPRGDGSQPPPANASWAAPPTQDNKQPGEAAPGESAREGHPSASGESAERPGASAPSTARKSAAANRAAASGVLHEEIPKPSRGARDTIHGHIRVVVRVTVDKSGTVVSDTLDDPGPSRYFARLATQAARKWKFAPADEPAPRVWVVRFEFGREGTTAHAVGPRSR